MSRAHRSRVTVEVPGRPGLYQLALLPGWDTVGVVYTADGAGALIRSRHSGLYCRANAGVLRSLPQPKVEAALRGQPGT